MVSFGQEGGLLYSIPFCDYTIVFTSLLMMECCSCSTLGDSFKLFSKVVASVYFPLRGK